MDALLLLLALMQQSHKVYASDWDTVNQTASRGILLVRGAAHPALAARAAAQLATCTASQLMEPQRLLLPSRRRCYCPLLGRCPTQRDTSSMKPPPCLQRSPLAALPIACPAAHSSYSQPCCSEASAALLPPPSPLPALLPAPVTPSPAAPRDQQRCYHSPRHHRRAGGCGHCAQSLRCWRRRCPRPHRGAHRPSNL